MNIYRAGFFKQKKKLEAIKFRADGIENDVQAKIISTIASEGIEISVDRSLLDACKAFVTKLKQVEKESLYVWQVAQNHGMKYTGVTYREELGLLNQAIAEAEGEITNANRKGTGDDCSR